LSIADRGYVFENGRIALEGRAAGLLNSPEIAVRYLGMGSAADVSGPANEALASRLRTVLFPAAAEIG